MEKIKRKVKYIFSIHTRRNDQEALAGHREEILFELRESKLKGRRCRFPLQQKMDNSCSANSPQKYIICNADEGEREHSKDRVLLLEYPELVFDGMELRLCFVYQRNSLLRGEYEYMLKSLEDYLK
jgi:NADH:ubiquinone oxidoreductase subunit F (NADH-binding)